MDCVHCFTHHSSHVTNVSECTLFALETIMCVIYTYMFQYTRKPVFFPSMLCNMMASKHLAAEADQCLLITKGPERGSIRLTRSRGERDRAREMPRLCD